MFEQLDAPLDNLDPDSNYFDDLFPSLNNSAQQSKYYTISDFNHNFQLNSNSLTILSYNIRSYMQNSDVFLAILGKIRFLKF